MHYVLGEASPEATQGLFRVFTGQHKGVLMLSALAAGPLVRHEEPCAGTLSMPKCRMRPYWTGFVARLTMLPALTAIGPSSVSATSLRSAPIKLTSPVGTLQAHTANFTGHGQLPRAWAAIHAESFCRHVIVQELAHSVIL